MNRHNARMNAFAVAQIDLETCRPGFSVGDLDAFHAKMMEHNVVCIEAPRPLHGIRLAQYADPDGLVVSIGEARTPR